MKIAHLCVSCFYIDGYSYQENELVAQNVKDGHDVLVIASTETYGEDRRISYLKPNVYLGSDGAKVIRLPYRKFLPHSVMRKLRMHPHVFEILQNFSPDIIVFHGLCGWELFAAARYKRAHPQTRFYVDCHEDFNNSARTWTSRWLLHYIYYRSILKSCLKDIDMVLCVTVESVDFAHRFYGIPRSSVELYPLGGKIFDDHEYCAIRNSVRTSLCVDDSNIVFVQSGKIDSTKKLIEALKAFSMIKDSRLRYVIIGDMTPEIKSEALEMMNSDSRIQYLGWMQPESLRRLLCGSDINVQPFGQSSTTQMSLCCRCAIIAQDLPSHRALFCDNGFLITEEKGLLDAFSFITDNFFQISEMQGRSAEFAKNHLDYRSLALRIYN